MSGRAVIVLLLVPLLLLPGSGGRAAAPAQPRLFMGAMIRIDTAGGFHLAAGEVAAIYRKLEAAVDFQRNKTAWKCVNGAWFEGDRDVVRILYGDPPLAPLTKGLTRQVRIDVLIGSAPQGEVAVAVEITIPGQAAHPPVVERVPAAMLGGNRLRAVGDKAHQLLAALMDRLIPCAVGLKIRGKHTIRAAAGHYNFERTYRGDARLPLEGDGTFSAELTLPDIYV